MIRRPPRSTLDRSSAASDVYKRQEDDAENLLTALEKELTRRRFGPPVRLEVEDAIAAVSYTHLRAHETVLDLVCRLLLEKKKCYTLSYQVLGLIPKINIQHKVTSTAIAAPPI